MHGQAIALGTPQPARVIPELGEVGRVDLDQVARIPGVPSVDFFRGVEKRLLEVGELRGWMPCFYYDASAVTAVFAADAAALARLLPSPALRPLRLGPRTGAIAFTAFEYRVTDIGPYNEFAISIPVQVGCGLNPPVLPLLWQMLRGQLHVFVWQLPVTTEIARVGGVEVYNYPKFLADLPFERGPDEACAAIVHEGRTELTLIGKALATRPGRSVVQHSHSVKDGHVFDAAVRVNPLEHARSREPFAARLLLGDGPIADRLREVGIGRLLSYEYLPKLQLILPAAERVG